MEITESEVAKLYVATFNRAPDAAGLDYWTNCGLSLEGIAQSFFDQSETQILYPSGTANSSFVISVYANLFNRAPDTDGFNYWIQALNNGNVSKQNFILAVINGAQNTDVSQDATILANKQTVGLDFVAKGLDNITLARDVMAHIDATQASVNAALMDIDHYSSPPSLEIQLVSQNLTGDIGEYDKSMDGKISSDGRYVAFASTVHLVPGEYEDTWNIFIRDTQAGTTTLVSQSPMGELPKSGGSSYMDFSISADCRYVAFVHSWYAPVDASGMITMLSDIYLKDTQTGTLSLVAGTQDFFDPCAPSVSADGRYVAFQGITPDNHKAVFLKDMQTDTMIVAAMNSDAPSISPDGRYLVFSSYGGLVDEDINHEVDVYLKDMQNDTITLVSKDIDGTGADANSGLAKLSSDGRYVVFVSEASNLVDWDTNNCMDIFLTDIQTGTITLVSKSPTGELGNGVSISPSISADGRYVVFQSAASNLVSGDTTDYDTFIKDIQTGTIALVSQNSIEESARWDDMFFAPEISADGRYIVFESHGLNNTKGDVFIVGNSLYVDSLL